MAVQLNNIYYRNKY